MSSFDESEALRLVRCMVDNFKNELSDEHDVEFCQLWDMCKDEEISIFLQKNGVVETLVLILEYVDSVNRLVEIVWGILTNILAHQSVPLVENVHKRLVTLIEVHIVFPDTPTLIQVTRLISIILSKSNKYKELTTPTIISQCLYFLQNSNNKTLIQQTADSLSSMIALDFENNTIGSKISEATTNVTTNGTEVYSTTTKGTSVSTSKQSVNNGTSVIIISVVDILETELKNYVSQDKNPQLTNESALFTSLFLLLENVISLEMCTKDMEDYLLKILIKTSTIVDSFSVSLSAASLCVALGEGRDAKIKSLLAQELNSTDLWRDWVERYTLYRDEADDESLKLLLYMLQFADETVVKEFSSEIREMWRDSANLEKFKKIIFEENKN
eukprot:GHVL01012854.1.p1 GENE.GHVL01012854.1~~GHVL01012854.1.p1  ORF type:complete len:386 (-),score=76.65 GHVL01012854.1:38-1195(-)